MKGLHANVTKKTATICDIGFGVGQEMVRKVCWRLENGGPHVIVVTQGATFGKLSFVDV